MAEGVHKYFCDYCRQFIFAETPGLLAQHVNTHNTLLHPMDFANWTSSGIVLSTRYFAGTGPLPQYLVPYGTAQNTPEHLDQKITEADRKFLASGLVRW